MDMTVPARFARRNDQHPVELPLKDLAPLETHLYSHESTDQDPANRWMREQIIEICQHVTAQEKKLDKPAP
jgi:DNA-binding transcriptional LysR family regulator